MNKTALSLLLKGISQYRLLTAEEERKYIQLAHNGDIKARNKMVKHNMRLVVNISRNYINRGIELEDLIQEGTEGLIDSINKFDLNSEYKFSTYAYYWIMQRVYRLVQDKSKTIRVPGYVYENMKRILTAQEELYAKGVHPTPAKIAEHLKMDEKKVNVAMSHMVHNLSLEYEYDKSEFLNKLEQNTYCAPEAKCLENEEMNERKRAIFDALETLSEKAQNVLILRYGLDGKSEGRTLKEVATIIGCSKERVRQLERRALETLREGGGRTERRRRLKQYANVS